MAVRASLSVVVFFSFTMVVRQRYLDLQGRVCSSMMSADAKSGLCEDEIGDNSTFVFESGSGKFAALSVLLLLSCRVQCRDGDIHIL